MNYRKEPDAHKENLTAVLKDIVERGITEVVFGGDIGSKESNSDFLTPLVLMVLNPGLFSVIMILFQKFQNILFLILHQMHR
jgi:Icc protein